MGKRIALIGDYTTTGGRIISGHQRVNCSGSAVALIGDKTTKYNKDLYGNIINEVNF